MLWPKWSSCHLPYITSRTEETLRRWNAAGSIPPLSVRPDGGITRLYARASRVILSSKITTSFWLQPNVVHAQHQFRYFDMILGNSSNVEATTSLYRTRHIRYFFWTFINQQDKSSISGLLVEMLLAISLRRSVLPALGGATINPRCPNPTGKHIHNTCG